MANLKYVKHKSGEGDIWEVIDDLGDEWEVKSKSDISDQHYLPKSEFAEVVYQEDGTLKQV